MLRRSRWLLWLILLAFLAGVAGADDIFGRAPLLLYLTAEPFEYPRSDWPDNVVMVGPCDWDPPTDPPTWLDDIDRPIVLVTTSSAFQDDTRLVEVALEALAEEPVAVLATLLASDPARVRTPANARVERFIPHAPVLDRVACAVTHGGMGATQKALAHGVPVCVVAFGRDQLEVARRVEVAGVGTRLRPAGVRHRGRAVSRRLRDAPAEAGAATETPVLTRTGILSQDMERQVQPLGATTGTSSLLSRSASWAALVTA